MRRWLVVMALAGCTAQTLGGVPAGYEAADLSYNDDLAQYLPDGVSAATMLISRDNCYYYQKGGAILPVMTQAGRYCIG